MALLLTFDEAADELGMSKTWVEREVRSKNLPVVCLGSARRIRHSDLIKYIDAHVVGENVGTPCAAESVCENCHGVVPSDRRGQTA